MERAAVLIGVRKTSDGRLLELPAVIPTIKKIETWARDSQKLKSVKVITDEKKPVDVRRIKDAIEKLVSKRTIEQLIVFFCGHGFNIDGEYWLLSGAPRDTDAAVNVEGSVRLARYCGIRHVVLISDACRTAAEGLQAQRVKGSEIFPNETVSGIEKPVDILFACARGKPSYEISDANTAAVQATKGYSALYTEVLLEYLQGEHEDVLDRVHEGDKYVGLLRMGDLADRLKIDVPQRLRAKLGVNPKIEQCPDDRISRQTGEAWLSRVLLEGKGERRSRDQAVTPVSRGARYTTFSVAETLVSASLNGDLRKWRDVLGMNVGDNETAVLRNAVNTQAAIFGPMQLEPRCGFKVRGARVSRTVQPNIGVVMRGTDKTVIPVNGVTRLSSTVLLILENGSGVVIPALQDFIAAISFDGGQLVDIAYEPSENSSRWSEYVVKAEELRAIRASIAAAASLGVFRLSGENQLTLARRMQSAKSIDPSLALYAAYAYDILQRRDLIDQMRAFMRNDLGVVLFDVALLSGGVKGERVVPSLPMLSQGWPLLSAYRQAMPPSLSGIEQHRLPSLWTLFDKTGVTRLEAAILSGEMQ